MKNKCKVTTLFNKNHISIVKETLTNPTKSYDWYVESRINVADKPVQIIPAKVPKLYKVKGQDCTKEISPLGFYYYKPFRGHANKYREKTQTDKTRVIDVYLGSDYYKISYYTMHNDITISHDQRPWEISDEGYMADHFVADLLKILNDLFDILEEEDVKLRKQTYSYEDGYMMRTVTENISDFKKMIYKELFGAANGPIYQTNNEKIESHGFDLKISFRKRKDDQ